MTPEQEARADIDRLLTAAGWHGCARKLAGTIIVNNPRRRDASVGASNARDRNLHLSKARRHWSTDCHVRQQSVHQPVPPSAITRH